MIFRSVFSSSKIKSVVETATAQLNQNAEFKIGKAYVSLADGIFPEIAVVVKDIEIRSSDDCLFKPLAEINSLKLPIALTKLLRGQVSVDEVQIQKLNLSLRSDGKQCAAKKGQSNIDPSAAEAPQSGQNLAESSGPLPGTVTTQLQSTKDPVTTESGDQDPEASDGIKDLAKGSHINWVKVKSLNINYEPISYTHIEVQDFTLGLQASDATIDITGILKLGGEAMAGEYPSHANINAKYFEPTEADKSARWTVAIDGGFREGNYEIQADLNQQTKVAKISAQAKHLPIGPLLPALKKYKLMNSEYNAKEMWISLDLDLNGSTENWGQSKISVRNFKLEGDIGEITTADFNFNSIDPLVHETIEIDMKGFKLDKFFEFVNRQNPSSFIANLGLINGRAQLMSDDQLNFDGDLSGLELIFSNKGVREMQVISLISGSVLLKNNKWNVQVSTVKPLEGIFDGKLSIVADRDWQDAKLQIMIDELQLSPQVQNLMTRSGRIGIINADLKMAFKQNDLSEILGTLKINDFMIEGIEGRKARAVINTQDNEFILGWNINEVKIFHESTAFDSLQPLFIGESEQNPILLNQFSTQISTKALKDFSWRGAQAVWSGNRLTSEGGWDVQGNVQGNILIDSKNSKKRFEIKGVRDSLQISTGEQ